MKTYTLRVFSRMVDGWFPLFRNSRNVEIIVHPPIDFSPSSIRWSFFCQHANFEPQAAPSVSRYGGGANAGTLGSVCVDGSKSSEPGFLHLTLFWHSLILYPATADIYVGRLRLPSSALEPNYNSHIDISV